MHELSSEKQEKWNGHSLSVNQFIYTAWLLAFSGVYLGFAMFKSSFIYLLKFRFIFLAYPEQTASYFQSLHLHVIGTFDLQSQMSEHISFAA